MTHKLPDIQKGIMYQKIEDGMSFRDAGRTFNLHHATVAKVYKEIKASQTVTRKKGSGRPKQWTIRMARRCTRLIMSNECQTAVQVKRLINAEHSKSFSVTTIKRILRSQGLNGEN